MQLIWLVYSAGKIGYFVFLQTLKKVYVALPIQWCRAEGKVHPKSFYLSKSLAKFLKIRVWTFRHLC